MLEIVLLRERMSRSWRFFPPTVMLEKGSHSTKRSMALKREDLPAPLLPTIPTFIPGFTEKFTLFRTGVRKGEYRMVTFWNSRLPSEIALVRVPEGMGLKRPGSLGRWVYSWFLYALVIEF